MNSGKIWKIWKKSKLIVKRYGINGRKVKRHEKYGRIVS
jgi:hypothetical protein